MVIDMIIQLDQEIKDKQDLLKARIRNAAEVFELDEETIRSYVQRFKA